MNRERIALVLVLCVGLLVTPVYAAFNALSLNAATATGAGTSFTLAEETASGMTWTVVVTGGPSAVTTRLEGSLDDSNWFTLDTSTATTSEMRHVLSKDVQHVRCNLVTLTGGTTPTVSCRIFKGKRP